MKCAGLVGLAVMAVGLSACGGGGGGATFKSFSTLEAGNTYRLSGTAVSVDYDTDPNTGAVTSGDAAQTPASVEFTLDDFGALLAAAITLDEPGGLGVVPPEVEFDFGNGDLAADGDTVDPLAADYGVAMTAAGDQVALVADPAAMGFEYQTFGIWASGLDTGTGRAGAGSFGRATPVSSLPVSGEATYVGQATGFYVDPDGMSFATFADFEADFNFGTRTMFASTSSTTAIDSVTGVSSGMPSLNFAGAGTVSVGGPFGPPVDGTFEADIAAIGLDGSLNGRLYGPNGEEIGGVFSLSGDAGQYLGAVGAVD